MPSYTFGQFFVDLSHYYHDSYLIFGHVDDVDLVDPLPDSVGLLTVLSLVEQPRKLVAELEHLHILDGLITTMSLITPDSSTAHICIPFFLPNPVKNLFGKGKELLLTDDLIYPCIGQPVPGHVIKGWLRTIS